MLFDLFQKTVNNSTDFLFQRALVSCLDNLYIYFFFIYCHNLVFRVSFNFSTFFVNSFISEFSSLIFNLDKLKGLLILDSLIWKFDEANFPDGSFSKRTGFSIALYFGISVFTIF